MNKAGDPPAAGGGGGTPDPLAGTPPAEGNPPATPPAGGAQPAAAIALPDNWRDTLPDDLKNEASLGVYKDVGSLAKSLVNAQKMIGKDKIVKPTENSSPEEWKAAMHALGVPEDVNKYDLGLTPEKAKVDKEFLEQFKVSAHSLGILPKQATKLVEWFGDINEKAMKAEFDKYDGMIKKGLDNLKAEWGDAYQDKIAGARHVIKEMVDEPTAKALLESGIGKNPAVLKLLDAMYKKTFGEKPIRDGQPGDGYMTPEQAKTARLDLMRDPKGPYWNKQHSSHGTTVAEVQRLLKIENSQKKS